MALAHESDFLERPAFQAPVGPVLQTGDRLADRFEIVAHLGRGGMGDVYEANDAELGARVALKTIRPDIAFSDEAVARFRKEVLRARAVAHPNVCRVYDLFSHATTDGRVVRFLTMELLDGATLADRIQHDGSLDIADALAIAVQLAAALDAAHQHGIVHRDLKPGNIMLTGAREGVRVVVTDFGLAHRFSEDTDVGSSLLSGPPGGTEEYVAPEIAVGRAIGPSADIYSFGVILSEMIGGTPSATRARPIPPAWARVIAACREPDPTRRPKTASSALAPISAGRQSTSTHRTIAVYAAVAVAAMALYASFSRFLNWAPNVGPGGQLLVADVANATGEPELAGVTELVKRQLEQSARVAIVEDARVAEVLRQMVKPIDTALTLETAREVAWRARAAGIVSGRVWRAGSAYGLTLRLERRGGSPEQPGQNWSRSYEAPGRTELRAAIRDGVNWVRTAAGEPATDISRNDRSVEEVTTDSWRALQLFSNAEALAAGARDEDALALLGEAVRLDRDFALAWMRQGDIRMSRREFAEGYADWMKALSVSSRRRLTPREEYRLRGMYASDTEDYAEAERVYRLYMLAYPNDADPYFYSARPLLMLGRVDDALAMLRRAADREPTGYRAFAQMAMFDIHANRPSAAIPSIAALRSRGQTAWADCIEGSRLFLTGDFRGALQQFVALERTTDSFLRMRAAALQAAVLADTMRRGEAEARLRRGAEADAARGDLGAEADKLLAIAELALRRGERDEARTLCLRSYQMDRAPQRMIREASVLARARFASDAQRVLDGLDGASPARNVRIGTRVVRAEILLASGHAAEAWTTFRDAAAMEAPGVIREYIARGAAAAGEYGVALAAYKTMAESPGYFWRYPDSEPPGSWSGALAAFIALSEQHPKLADSAAVGVARTRLNALRAAELP